MSQVDRTLTHIDLGMIIRSWLMLLASGILTPVAWVLRCHYCWRRGMTAVVAHRRADGRAVVCWKCPNCEGLHRIF